MRWQSIIVLAVACRSSAKDTASVPPSASSLASAAPSSASAPPRVELPSAELTFQLVARSSGLLAIDRLDNASLVYPEGAHDALLLGDQHLTTLRGVFAGVDVPKGWSFGPVEGRWPDLALLTLADRGYRGYAKQATVLRRSGARWTPLPGALAHEGTFVVVAPERGTRLLLVQNEDGARFVEPDGKAAPITLQQTVDGQAFTITGASVDAKGQLFVSGFIHEPAPRNPDAGLDLRLPGDAPPRAIAIVQRWPPGVTAPILDHMPDPKSARVDDLSGSGVFSAGDTTFALFGASHTLGRFQDGRWTMEALPILPGGGIRDFALAKDGSVFFGTTDHPSGEDVYLRRSSDGRYTRVSLPPKTDVWGLYAESGTALWVVATPSDPSVAGSMVFFTRSLGEVVTIDPPASANPDASK